MTEEILPAELVGKSLVSTPPPSGKRCMNCQEVRIICIFLHETQVEGQEMHHPLIQNELLARSASSSIPRGVTNGDFELNAAAIVNAGSRQRNTTAIKRSFPR
jgi:hypothetical protein